jgi:hypothetical protein
MKLEMPIKIKEPESTPTSNEPRSTEPGGTRRDEDTKRRYPPDDLLLAVVMTFLGDMPHLAAREVGVAVKGDRIEEALRRLIEATREQLASSDNARAELLCYPPENWFRFVPPDQTAFANRATLADGFISVLNQLYEFKDDSVKGFLEENLSLGSLLLEAHAVIRKHFGPEVKMVLEVVTDPEAVGDQQLFVLIRTELSRKEARAHLAELDRGWWLNALPATEGKMEIALE